MRRKQKNKKNPRAEYTPEQQEMDADLDIYTALDDVAKSPGGKLMIDAAIDDILASLETLANKYKTESHASMMGICAELSAKLNFVQMLTRAEGQKDTVTELLKESLKQTE